MRKKSSKNKRPEYSVIMGVYNAKRTILASVESILSQKGVELELIIVDDASHDGTWEILKKIASSDKRVCLLRNDTNQGLAASLNKALQKACGALIARHDADDLSCQDRLRRQRDFLKKNPSVFLVGTGARVVDGCGKKIKISRPLSGRSLVKALERTNAILHPTIVFRNESRSAQRVWYRDKFRYAQDYDLYLRLLTAGKRLENMPDILVTRCIHPGSVGESHSALQMALARKAQRFWQERCATGSDSYGEWDPAFTASEISVWDDTKSKMIKAIRRRDLRSLLIAMGTYLRHMMSLPSLNANKAKERT